jgi:hypothetical protein
MIINKSFKIKNYSFSLSIDAVSFQNSSQAAVLKALKNAAVNLVDLAGRVLGIEAEPDIRLGVKFRVLKGADGMYYPASGLIKIDAPLISAPAQMEQIFFHELVHYLFESYYKQSWFYELFHEAIAVYFQNLYYPDNYTFHKLIKDRFGPNEFAAGYFLLDKLNKMPGLPFNSFFQSSPDAKAVKRHQKIINAFIDAEYAAAKSFYNNLIKNIDIVLIDEKPQKSGAGYGIIYRDKQMYSPFIAYLPARSLKKLNFENIYVKITKIPKCYSAKFVLRETGGEYLKTLASFYAHASVSMPAIKDKVNNICLSYE